MQVRENNHTRFDDISFGSNPNLFLNFAFLVVELGSIRNSIND